MSGLCTVQLDVFEGPLDLLLHLIKKNEVQITDIPIAQITDQYLAALEADPSFANLDGAGEYLVMAATLTYIKSLMLLPTPGDGEEESEEDPRAALVQQLLEYERFREMAVMLGERSLLGRDVFSAPAEAVPAGVDPDAALVRDASLGDLLEALHAVLARLQPPPAHEVMRPQRSVADAAHSILARFAVSETLEFLDLFAAAADRAEVIVLFLALLELMRLRVVYARQAERFGPIALGLAVADLAEAGDRIRDIDHWERMRGEGGGNGNTRAWSS